jgi:tyrosine-protein kinase Etk/Wzc
MINEAEEGGKVIFVTSTIAGEGKTFNAINLAHSFALTGKKGGTCRNGLKSTKIDPLPGIG